MNNLRNKVQLIGHLGNDPELRNLKGDKKVMQVSIATKETYRNAKGDKVVDTQWHRLVAWNKTAENMATFLKKGSEVAIQGKLQHESYTDKDGNKRNVTRILVTEFMLLGKSTSNMPKAETVEETLPAY